MPPAGIVPAAMGMASHPWRKIGGHRARRKQDRTHQEEITMHVNVAIHPSWLARPEELGRRLAALAQALENPHAEDNDGPETARPEAHRPARPMAAPDEDDTDEDQPRDGRQLLGWAGKQVPDMKGPLIGFGRKKGYPGRIVDWRPEQVIAAYRFARGRQTGPGN